MGSMLESDSVDWDAQLFIPSNHAYPVQVFISVVEHTAKEKGICSDSELIAYAVSQLDITEIPKARMKLFSQQASWDNFKSIMLSTYYRTPTFDEKVDLFRSLVKGAREDCSNFLIRIRYAAGLIRDCVTCSCDAMSMDVEEVAKILFMAGIEPFERDFCKLKGERDLDDAAKALNLFAQGSEDDYRFIENMEDAADIPEVKEKKELTDVDKPQKPYKDIMIEVIQNSANQGLTWDDIVQSVCQNYPYFSQLPQKEWCNIKFSMKENLLDSKVFSKDTSPDGALLWTLRKTKDAIRDNIKIEPEEFDPLTETEESKYQEEVNNDTPNYTFADGVYTCNQCGARCNRKLRIKRHLLSHLFTFYCKKCPFKTRLEKTFAFHQANWCYPVKCDHCDYETQSKEKMEKHMQRTHESKEDKKKRLTCEHCGKHFHHQTMLKSHVERMHLHVFNYFCDQCDYKSYLEKELKMHMEMHTGQTTWKCEVCGKGFNREPNLHRHLLVHKSAEERILYGCVEPGCDSSYSQKVNLRLHMERKHGKGLTDFKTVNAKKSKQATYYKKEFKEKGDRGEVEKITKWSTEGKLHVEDINGKMEIDVKEDKMFDAMMERGKLMTFEDSNETKHRCRLCNRRPFRFKHNAVDHIIKVHNLMPAGSKMYRCLVNPESCRYETYQKTRIVFHFKIQHKEDYGGQVHHCDKCVKTFNWPHMLRTHMKQAHPEPGEDKPKPFQCPECGHLSKTKQACEAHRRTHKPLEERRKFACDQCTQRFPGQAQLTHHIRTVHLKIKQHRCKLCNTTYSNTGNLEEHIAIKHMGFKNGKEWRVARKDPAVKITVKNHEAYEYIKHWKDGDQIK